MALDWRGWVNERLERPALAATDYEQALNLSPNRFTTRVRLAALYLWERNDARALPHLEYLCQHHPEAPDGFIGLASYWFEKNDLPQARELLDRALQQDPNNAEALLLRGRVELRAEQPAEAETWLRKAQDRLPTDVRVVEALARSLQQQQNRAEEAAVALARYQALRTAGERLKHLLLNEVHHDLSSPKVPFEVGELFLQLGQDPFGEQWLYTALDRDPMYEPAHRLLIDHFEKTNQPERALEHKEALEQIKARAQTAKTR
jgi:tetratricopeptide (TPR) repeat protein